MFRKKQLIFVAFLSGCTTVANDGSVNPIEPINDTIIEEFNPTGRDFLENIDSTLEEADAILEKIEKNKANTENKIHSLEHLHSEDVELISELNRKLTIKDSIIADKAKEIENLYFQLEFTENKFLTNEEILQRYIKEYNSLVEENNSLKEKINENYSHIEYLDSLILTNKKLTKVYEAN